VWNLCCKQLSSRQAIGNRKSEIGNMNDLRYALRMLLKNPGFTVVATLALALGIGANTAIFSIVNAVLLRPLPLREPEQLVAIFGAFRGGAQLASVSPADFKDYRDQNQVFEQLAAAQSVSVPVSLTGSGEPERLTGAWVTANYFEALGIRPGLGRGFVSSDEQEGEH
jgi:putative ABC transport system permease protein